MNNSGVYSERKSWRQPQSHESNRWFGRISFTLIALLLFALLLYYLFGTRSAPVLHTFVIQPGSLDGDVIMPAMFGATASDTIVTNFQAQRIEGTVSSVRKKLNDTTSLKQFLGDADDCTLVVVRGYLLSGSDGQPMIACSDLGPADGRSASGLLPLTEVLTPLASEAPASFSGTRLVVLDIEPFATMPRLNQSDVTVFESLAVCVKELNGEHASSVWVMVTRGPLQNAGWDPRANMPISTATLNEALLGAANFNDDHEITLRELCDYMASRYQRLGQRTAAKPPQIMVLRGGVGLITKNSEISDGWIAKAQPVVEPKPDEQLPPPGEFEKDAQKTAGNSHIGKGSLHVKAVRYQADQENASKIAKEENVSQPGDPAAAESDMNALAETTASVLAEPPNFWELRDALESSSSRNGPHPIAVAPQIWRKLLFEVLHAEIETLDPKADQSRAEMVTAANAELTMLLRDLSAADDPEAKSPLDTRAYSPGLVRELATRWASARRTQNHADEQVRVANELQKAIAIARVRLTSRLLYREQAILADSAALSDDSDWPDTLAAAETFLAEQHGEHADTVGMEDLSKKIRLMVSQSDQWVMDAISELLDTLAVADEGKSWPVVRRIHAWLRSPLPSGEMRKKLTAALTKISIERPDTKHIALGISNIDLATPAAPSDIVSLKLHPLNRDWRRFIDRAAEHETAQQFLSRFGALDAQLRATDTKFTEQFAAALRIDPVDAAAEDRLSPILHDVAAAPRRRYPRTVFLDSSERAIAGDKVTLKSATDFLLVEVQPDSDRTTSYRLTSQQRDSGEAGFSEPPLRMTWRTARGVQLTNRSDSVTLTIPADETGVARLDVRALREREKASPVGELAIRVEPLGVASDPLLARLAVTKRIAIQLPKADQVRMVMKTDGLSGEAVSNQDTLPGGLWLRGFASRKTNFSFSLYNESGRATRAHIWLLKLKHPFLSERVTAYWPDLLAHRIDALESSLLNADGRVDAHVLVSDQVLKGPTELALPAGNLRTPLTWKRLEPPVTDAAKPSAPAAAAVPVSDVDISHGMAVVVRLLDDTGTPAPGSDQIVWLVPKPWSPESYVDIPPMTYRDGRVSIVAGIKSHIDGDSKLDQIPEIDESPVSVRWTQDDQWEQYKRDSTEPRVARTLQLRPGAIGERMEIAVPTRQETFVRLDVDGWPRAIRRNIKHREGIEGSTRTRWDTIDFSSVSIDYGDKPPILSPDDLPISGTVVQFPSRVTFRGSGKSLTTLIYADLSVERFQDAIPPEIQLKVNNELRRKYWTDRTVSSIAKSIGDDGSISMVTTVSDLQENWTTEASAHDAQFIFQAEIVGDPPISTRFDLTLDTTPPKVDRLRRIGMDSVFVGDSVRWNVEASDPPANQVSSGIGQVVIDVDKNGDGKPDSQDHRYQTQSSNVQQMPASMRTFETEKAGPFPVAVQVWDNVGLASRGEAASVEVHHRAKPKPVPTAASAVGAKPLQPPPPPKLGRISGRIASGRAMHGWLTLSPTPDKMRPSDGRQRVDGSNPDFNFSNLPPGEYTLKYAGTQGNSLKTYEWSGLKTDVAGGKANLSLTPDD